MFFFNHNSVYRCARGSINGSKHADDLLVSTESLSQKVAHWIGVQGQLDWPNMHKHALIVTSPTEDLNPKSSNFFNRN